MASEPEKAHTKALHFHTFIRFGIFQAGNKHAAGPCENLMLSPQIGNMMHIEFHNHFQHLIVTTSRDDFHVGKWAILDRTLQIEIHIVFQICQRLPAFE